MIPTSAQTTPTTGFDPWDPFAGNRPYAQTTCAIVITLGPSSGNAAFDEGPIERFVRQCDRTRHDRAVLAAARRPADVPPPSLRPPQNAPPPVLLVRSRGQAPRRAA